MLRHLPSSGVCVCLACHKAFLDKKDRCLLVQKHSVMSFFVYGNECGNGNESHQGGGEVSIDSTFLDVKVALPKQSFVAG